jgi:hypothetical protein
MKVHVIAADLRAIAARMRKDSVPHRDAAELDKIANLLVASLEARELEVRAGTMTMQRRGGTVVSDGRVLDASNLFRVKPA